MKASQYLLAALILTACTNTTNQDSPDTQATTTAPDTTAKADTLATAKADTLDAATAATDIAQNPTFNGVITLSPRHRATLTHTIGGKIHSLNIMPGQHVSKGQTIATLDNPQFIELQQTYLEAAAQSEYHTLEYQRQSTLGTQDAASAKRVQQSKADYLTTKSRLEATAAQLRALGIDPNKLSDTGIIPYLPVTAPFAGYATDIHVNLGSYLDPGQAVCDIIDKTHPLIQLTVYEKDLVHIKQGSKVQFRVNGLSQSTFEATIITIDQSIDETDYSVKVYAQIKGEHKDFRPGMYVRAKVMNNE